MTPPVEDVSLPLPVPVLSRAGLGLAAVLLSEPVPEVEVKAGSGEVLMSVEVWLRAVVMGTTTVMLPLLLSVVVLPAEAMSPPVVSLPLLLLLSVVLSMLGLGSGLGLALVVVLSVPTGMGMRMTSVALPELVALPSVALSELVSLPATIVALPPALASPDSGSEVILAAALPLEAGAGLEAVAEPMRVTEGAVESLAVTPAAAAALAAMKQGSFLKILANRAFPKAASQRPACGNRMRQQGVLRTTPDTAALAQHAHTPWECESASLAHCAARDGAGSVRILQCVWQRSCSTNTSPTQ